MEPEAYRIGWQPFLGLEIWLDSRPLIPRVETEWWAEQLLAHYAKPEPVGAISGVRLGLAARSAPGIAPVGGGPMRFLDLCAGSGAIGCAALKYLPEAEVWFAELDLAHEATIRKNIEANGLDTSRAHVAIGDLFGALPPILTFDIIAANPPYVPAGRKLPREVVDWEPALALRAGPDGLGLIRRIAAALPERLAKPGGVAWVECDAKHAEEARAAFGGAGFRAELMHDQYGRPRVVTVSWPHE
ncbi:MAG: peptide chain release factor N(5)-glutamine methyltransferase [Patescibacteria group bacterium]|nr:peptide chain release factor N(5)-glutamine methyltransferase [Patescibacteria group bacterium]MDE1944627.1 peptide chain release factor N(5)-glutamine methyltransferase [Patescibacteria group bacterium]MDE1945404.1 peptide chain release factor N(5)-glutamine methyltransferase [Patescibacteria group bacterium]MDE2057769.1 peptide chain release factor N(5)-glutamine methyltransferase [Patescibacteria group bacterium]